MNDEARRDGSAFLTTAELARRPDFALGTATVSPSRRVISGPGGTREIEPRVMQVLVVLAEAAGLVVTRRTLFERCWGTSDVGDDSLNRAVAAVRKLGADIAGDSFAVETIPRTGYRLTAEPSDDAAHGVAPSKAASTKGYSRRRAIAAAAAASVVAVAGGSLWLTRRRETERVDRLVQQGVEQIEYGDGSLEAAKFLRQAVQIDPDDSKALGLLAFALAANSDAVGDWKTMTIVNEAERAANRALAIDPGEVNARLALTHLGRTSLDMASTEDRLRELLGQAPQNIFVMRQLWNLLQSGGRSRDALALVQRALGARPLAASNNFPLGQLQWIIGRPAEADRILERAIQYWPNHRYVRFARFILLAFTGRAPAAMAMLDSPGTAPQGFSPQAVSLWRDSLAALSDPSPAMTATARSKIVAAVERDPRLARHVVLPLAALGEVDAAFDIANKLLIFDPPAAAKPSGRSQPTSLAWRFTPWLFTPPAASMRADPRFLRLCEGTGLSAYWRKRNITPDYLVADQPASIS